MINRTCSLCGSSIPGIGPTTCVRCQNAAFVRNADAAISALRPLTVATEHQVGADAATALGQAKEDARMFGIGFVVDGKRVSPQSVVVVREPKAEKLLDDFEREVANDMDTSESRKALAAAIAPSKPLEFDDFWLREGPSLAWDEDRKRAARRIWDAARKGGA